MISLDLPALRAEWLKTPRYAELLKLCNRLRSSHTTRLEWCIRKIHGRYRGSAEHFGEILHVFRILQNTGFGTLQQPTVRARARFRWNVLPVNIDLALRSNAESLPPGNLLPHAARLNVPIEPPKPITLPGWTRHEVTIRPDAKAELYIPDNLALPEAEWLGHYLRQLVQPPPSAPQ